MDRNSTYRTFKSFLNVSSYVKDVLNRQHIRILSNFRSGCLPLAVETGDTPGQQFH